MNTKITFSNRPWSLGTNIKPCAVHNTLISYLPRLCALILHVHRRSLKNQTIKSPLVDLTSQIHITLGFYLPSYIEFASLQGNFPILTNRKVYPRTVFSLQIQPTNYRTHLPLHCYN